MRNPVQTGFQKAGWRWVLLLTVLLAISCQHRGAAGLQVAAESDQAFPQADLRPVKHPDWSRNASIYEVNVRQFSHGGTFREFAEHLPRLKEMGVGIVWFMPIHPIGEKNRKGTLGSYYSVKDYMAVNPEFGSLDDFISLVAEIHSMGMHVIIDWVANHCAWDNPLTKEHPDWFTRDIHEHMVTPVDDWTDVVDFNYNSPGLWRYMIGAMRFWVEDVGVDGFRCDVAGMVPLGFWNVARAELDRVKPVFMLAEWESPAAHEYAFDMTYGWDLYHLMTRIAKGLVPATAVGTYVERQKEVYPPDAYRMYFTSNHDENSWNGTVFETMGDAAEVMAVLASTLNGMPLIYGGQEAGLAKRLAFFEKDEIAWKHDRFADVYATLLGLKIRNRALWNGAYGGDVTWVHTSDDSNVFASLREKDGDRVLAVYNLSNAPLSVTLDGDSHFGTYVDAFTGDRVAVGEGTVVGLEGWGYRVYQVTPGPGVRE